MSHRASVLVLLDDPDLRPRLVAALAREGARTDAVSDAAAAELLLAARRYDAFVAELSAADRDAPRVLAAFACRPDRPPFFVLIPSEDPRLVRCAAALRPDEAVSLPTGPVDLAAKIARCVAARRQNGLIPVAAVTPDATPAAGRPVETPAQPLCEPASETVIAVRLADSSRAKSLANRLAASDHVTLVAESTDELHALLNRDRVDVLVIDDQLPGFLSGLDILDKFHKELLRPEAVLIGECRERDAARIKALKLTRLLSPGCTLDELVEAARAASLVRRAAVPSIPAKARVLVANCDAVRPMPQLLVKLLSYLSTDAACISASELARDISSDPKATAELLRYTSSASVGRRRRVTGVAEAIALLGPRQVISLFLSGVAVASANDLLRSWPEPLRTWYHRRAVLNASAARAFAKLAELSPDTAFLLGLLQDLGVAVFASAHGERYAQIAERARSVPQLRLDRLELAAFACTHADISAALLQKWGLPPLLAAPVLAHHGSDSHLSRTEQSFVQVMRLAEALTDLADRPCPQRRQMFDQLLAGCPPRVRESSAAAIAEAVSGSVESSALFSLPSPDMDALRMLAGRQDASAGQSLQVEALSH